MSDALRLAGIVKESIVDGPGIRFAVFCQGCPHDCPQCHNPATHDFAGGTEVSVTRIIEAIKANPLIQGVTFSGGEPFCQAEAFLSLAEEICMLDNLDIVIFSGYTYEELREMGDKQPAIRELLSRCDLLVDGRFVQEQKDLSLKFRGSRNQRIIDIKASEKKGEVVLAQEYM